MKKTITSAALCLLAMNAQSAVIDGGLPTVTVTDGEITQQLQGQFQQGDKPGDLFFVLPGPVTIGGDNGFQISSLTVEFNQDPFIVYGLSVIDLGAPSTFGFAFGTPIVPTANPATVKSTYAASFTDANDGVFSLTPPATDPDGDGINEVQVFKVFDGAFKNAGVDIGKAFAFAGAVGTSGTIPAEAAGPLAAPAGGAFVGLELDVDATLSGHGDVYTANGRGEIIVNPVPEAATTVSLLGIAGLAMGAFSRFRRK